MRDFISHCKVQRVLSSVAAGQAANNGSVVDMAGFDSVTFIAELGPVEDTGTATMTVQQGTESGGGDMATLSGPSAVATTTGDEGLLVVEVYRPRERYVRCVITTATANGTIDGCIAIQRDPQVIPITAHADVIASSFSQEPSEA